VNENVPKYFRPNDFDFHEDKPSIFASDGRATSGEIREALSALIERKLILRVDDKYTEPEYILSESFWIEDVSKLPSGRSYYDRLATRGTNWLTEALTNIHRENSQIEIPSAADIPAADRYVSVNDNEKIEEILESVADLISAVKEERTNSFDDKEGRLGELLAFDLLLQQPQISVPAVEFMLRETVSYLAIKFADKAIGIAANALLLLAASFFGIHF
tara:strand:+ start:1003 stop:1656 length:654 start_codon:yes stop_codon:yes gene_type:complete